MPDQKVAKRYFVSGTVQGVGFRFFAVRSARHFGIAGYAKNLRDGRVEVYAVGLNASLASFRKALEKGPSGALVEDVSEEEARMEPRWARDFTVEQEGW